MDKDEDDQHKAPPPPPPPPPEPPCRKLSGYFRVLLNQDEINQYEKDSAEWRKNLENWKKAILDSKVSNVYDLGDTFYETFTNPRLQFLKEVDLAIKEYFLYKYNRDIDELIRISKNVNNFKMKDHFHKVSTLSEMKDCYFDGEYCYLTTYQGYGNGYIVKHWLEN